MRPGVPAIRAASQHPTTGAASLKVRIEAAFPVVTPEMVLEALQPEAALRQMIQEAGKVRVLALPDSVAQIDAACTVVQMHT